MNRSCGWCCRVIEDVSDEWRHMSVYCSQGCFDADKLFRMMYSDDEINRRRKYKEMTDGTSE